MNGAWSVYSPIAFNVNPLTSWMKTSANKQMKPDLDLKSQAINVQMKLTYQHDYEYFWIIRKPGAFGRGFVPIDSYRVQST